MPRLPLPGQDEGVWGSILNDYLSAVHGDDGQLKPGVVTSTNLSSGAVGASQLADDTITEPKLAITNAPAAGQVLSYNGSGLQWITSPSGVTDHGLLSGLSDDDHPQYHNDARGDARYYTQGQIDSSLSAKANDTSVVHNTSNESVAGIKTFTSAPVVPDSSFTIAKTTGLQGALDGKQNSDADLTAIAGLTPSDDDVIQRKSGSWTNRTPTQFKTDLSLTKSDVGLSNVDNTSDASKNSATATLTNKTISGASNTLSNIPQSAVTSLSSDLNARAIASTSLAFIRENIGSYAGRSTVTSDTARTVVWIGSTQPGTGANQFITGVDIWFKT